MSSAPAEQKPEDETTPMRGKDKKKGGPQPDIEQPEESEALKSFFDQVRYSIDSECSHHMISFMYILIITSHFDRSAAFVTPWPWSKTTSTRLNPFTSRPSTWSVKSSLHVRHYLRWFPLHTSGWASSSCSTSINREGKRVGKADGPHKQTSSGRAGQAERWFLFLIHSCMREILNFDSFSHWCWEQAACKRRPG